MSLDPMKQAHPGKPSRPTRWWSQTGSNRRPHACKARALPTELWPLRAGSRQIGSRQSKNRRPRMPTACCRMPKAYSPLTNLVGLGGLEPPTSRLSSARSNQLSYKPEARRASGRSQKPEAGSQKVRNQKDGARQARTLCLASGFWLLSDEVRPEVRYLGRKRGEGGGFPLNAAVISAA